MLEITGIDIFRGETQVLWDISLTVEKGERVAILGSNGAGKSTLLAAIIGMLKPTAGSILFHGLPITGSRPFENTRRGLALVPEGRRVYKEMSVIENLKMGAYPKRGRSRMAETMEEVVSLFPILGERREQLAGTLSGGEQQMLAIGRALMSRPELLLVDELSLGLAPVITKEIFRVLMQLGQEVTILMVEQNVEQALKYSQRAYVLESGRVVREGDSRVLGEDPGIRRAYLGM
ncbi:MAG: ABC transporter ATP-binding protein [Desulfuromusa sp.]|nr:ABC transporter ATP-binding protein [Desulfuromusa sp.]